MTTHSLYRFFDAEGALLYVGRTVDARSRWRTHERTKEWFDSVASVTREVLPDAAALDAAERTAIVSESPRHNIVLNTPAVVEHKPGMQVRLLCVAEAADLLGVHATEVQRLMALRELPPVRIGSAVRVDRYDVDAYVDRIKRAS